MAATKPMVDQQNLNPARANRVLVVEDSPEYAAIIGVALERGGHECRTVATGEEALALLDSYSPEVVILDIVLPGIDGVEVCRRLRQASDAYVIMLTARADEVDKLVGLAVGADDYLTKPFSSRELVARIGAMMRRPRASSDAKSDVRTFGDLRINPLTREVFWGDEELALTRIEFNLLDQISARPHMVHARQLLLDRVWGEGWVGDDHVVDVHVANLRKKIDREGITHLKTVRGVGYRMSVTAS